MPEPGSRERLQPSLLDRLTDDEPQRRVESRERRVLSLRQLIEAVTRDLSWLFNTGNLGQLVSLEQYPEVARSVVNYGVPDLAGRPVSSFELGAIENDLRHAIWTFEPRLRRNTVQVRTLPADQTHGHNKLAFEIEGELWAKPLPLRLFLRTEIDLEAGSVKVEESRGSGGA